MSFIKGNNTEYRFKKCLESNGYTVEKSTEKENIDDHIDLTVKKHNKQFTVDVKGLKKLSRGDQHTDENYHFVEIVNVNGDKGWLQGKANYICFEINDYWILVDRRKLLSFVWKTTDIDKHASHARFAYKKIYSRNNKKDLITLVKTIDLMYLSEKIFKK